MAIEAAFMVPHPPLIVPAIGRGGEKQIKETTEAYEKVADEIAKLAPETIIITSPHSILYSDYFHISPGKGAKGSFAKFNASEVSFDEEYDEELVDVLNDIAYNENFPAGTLGERNPELDHGTMVPLWFIRNKYKGGKIVRIGLSGLGLLNHYRFGQMIQKAVNDTNRRVVFVASGDLSHKLQDYGPYGFSKEGPIYDERIMDVAKRAAFDEMFDFKEDFCEKAAECGHRSFVIMAGALDGIEVDAKVLSHQDITGVGYGIAEFFPIGTSDKRHFRNKYISKIKESIKDEHSLDEYVNLAWKSLESYIINNKVLDLPKDLPMELLETKAGAFVSIHKSGRLRGCIGTILPTTSCVAEEIIQNAISASTRDSRFNPISVEELPDLEINVDVLSEPEPIDSTDELDVKKYGVIVSSGHKRGLLLPDLDGVDSVAQQISIARQKGGIAENEPISLQRFQVIRHI